MSDNPQPGQLLGDHEGQRDAIHVALSPATAAVALLPGQHVGFVRSDDAHLVGPTEHNIGIVDPFLTDLVDVGQRFWLFLYPNSVTGLRHIWTHPAFNAAAAEARVQAETAVPSQPVRSLREDFLEALAENEDDTETRMVFSDWLDDQGEHEEAERHRQWPKARQWLVNFVEMNNLRDQDDDEDGYYPFIGYDELIAFGHRSIEEKDYYLSCGANMNMCDSLRSERETFWHNWAIITGVAVPAEAVEQSSFGCAC